MCGKQACESQTRGGCTNQIDPKARDPGGSRFVYHAAAKLPLHSAERLVRDSEERARIKAKEAVAAVVRDLRDRGYQVVASGVIISNRTLTAPLETTLAAHPLLHSAEGELFRQAIIDASEACKVARSP